MAREIMRVGRSWFVTTPNRWYPFEFHLRLPLVTWLPGELCWRAAQIVHYNHVRQRYAFFTGKPTGIRLLGARQLASLFPDSHVIKQCVTLIFPETLIAVGGNDRER